MNDKIVTYQNAIIFDEGKGRAVASKVSVSKGDSVKSFSIDATHLPVSSAVNLGTTVTDDAGRRIRGAIWEVRDDMDINQSPMWLSTNVINMNSIQYPKYDPGSNDKYYTLTFEFDINSTPQKFQTSQILLGIVSVQSNGTPITDRPEGNICIYGSPGGVTNYTIDIAADIDVQTYNKRIVFSDISIKSFGNNGDIYDNGNNQKPKLIIKNITARTLSKRYVDKNDVKDFPNPNSDSTVISSSTKINGYSTQWNTAVGNHPWNTGRGHDGYDIYNEGYGLRDKELTSGTIDSSRFTSNRSNPYWVFNRSRILFKFDQFTGSATSVIEYSINGKPAVSFTEIPGTDTTLLICPRDEGVDDNSEMRIKLTRKTKMNVNSTLASSTPMEIVFKTFVKPEVHIAYPKPIIDNNGVKHNYALRANEILNNPFEEDYSASERICSTLNVLLTKDGGDESGFPIYTRIFIQEFKGEYGDGTGTFTGEFKIPSNDAIESGKGNNLTPTASWRGVQLDDGTIMQISGMKTKGFTWDDIAEDTDSTKTYHKIATGVTTGENNVTTVTYASDRRLIFRSGYKYLIKVRRFHSAAAGADSPYIYEMKVTESFGKYSHGYYPPYKNATEYPSQRNGYPVGGFTPDTIETNNTNINEILPNERWVGPADGSSGLALNSKDQDIVYPGFSKADYVIIDCVDAIPSNSNLIVSRPAVQEIGADHWITFAYRHMNKNASQVDDTNFTNVKDKLPSQLSVNLNADGSSGNMPSDQLSSGLGKTWSGQDNTAKRIHDMYYMCVWYILGLMKARLNSDIDSYTCSTCEQSTAVSASVKIYVNFQGFNPENSKTKPPRLLIYDDGEFLSDQSYKSAKASGVLGETYDENAYKSCIFYGCQNSYSGYNDTHPKHDIYGNQYKWFPIINATTDKGTKNIVTKYTTKSTGNINKFSDDMYKKNEDEKFYEPDKTHAINISNTYQTGFSAEFGVGGVPEKWHEWYQPDGYLYTSKAQSGAASTETEAYGQNGDQMFGSTPTSEDTSSSGSYQHLPGRLYLRVPPSQDCEYGTITPRKAIPSRSDLSEPLVRTNHFLWFKTHIFGSFIVEYVFKYKPHSQVTDAEGNTSCTISKDATTVSKILTNRGLEDLDALKKNFKEEYKNLTEKDLAYLDDVLKNIGISKITLGDNSITYNNILTVYGEDNGGLGRCLSADDYTALWFDKNKEPHGVNDEHIPLDGSIEIPIKVRYTPLVQPIISNNTAIVGENKITAGSGGSSITYNRTTYTRSSVSLRNYRESASDPVRTDGTAGKSGFVVSFSYGMYRSAMQGNYYSFPKEVAAATENQSPVMADKYQRLSSPIHTGYIESNADSENYNTDIFPSLGICNAFMVLLIPSDAKKDGKPYDYTNMPTKWFSNRDNFEGITSSTDSTAKTVIVADMAKTEVYKYIAEGKFDSSEIDHKLRTKLDCVFNYKNLLTQKTNAVQTSWTNADNNVKSRKNVMKLKTWYDLVVVPIFTDADGFESDEDAAFKGMTFKYKDGAGEVNPSNTGTGGTAFGSKSSLGENVIARFYGSTPLVVRKFLRIAENRISGGGSSGGSDPNPPDYEEIEIPAPFNTSHAILYPNVNKTRYGAIIPECPGFWLDNTFRVVIRGPHFRDDATVAEYLANSKLNVDGELKTATTTSEVSLESATNGKLTGTDNCKNFKITDMMIHFGKYDDIPMQYNSNRDVFEKFLTPVFDKSSNQYEYKELKFNSDEFQTYLNQRSQDKEWLNSIGIYTMRTNPEAFSKCAPEIKANGDERDIITAGSLNADNLEEYSKRLVEFNPHLVNVHTPYPEGYYIQVRYLNSEYSTESSAGEWSEWEGGVADENAEENNQTGIYNLHTDVSGYYVPARDYNDVFTSFRSYIKESFPGSYINMKGTSIQPIRDIYGAGSQSINIKSPLPEGSSGVPGYTISGEGNKEYYYADQSDTSIVPDKLLDYPYPPMIWAKNTSDNFSDSDKFKIGDSCYDRHQTYWEMRYVDYIIRNMAKLYYGETDWMLHDKVNNYQLTPEDLGWTKAMAHGIPKMNELYPGRGWEGTYIDTVINSGYEVDPSDYPTPPQYQDKSIPLNTDRYFRKAITSKDFDDLLIVLQKTVGFLRSPYITGNVTKDTDIKDANGYSTGYSILPISPELLSFKKLNNKYTVIGHSVSINDADKGYSVYDEEQQIKPNDFYKRVDCNYLQHLWLDVSTKLCGR